MTRPLTRTSSAFPEVRDIQTAAKARAVYCAIYQRNLSRSEIAAELYLSVNTVKTHMCRLFAKLGAHSRTEVVERARRLGLLASKPRVPCQRQPTSTSTVVTATRRFTVDRAQRVLSTQPTRQARGLMLQR
jgi:DNA-binding CsgD family transcriptional regulator